MELLSQHSKLFVRQIKNWVEIAIDWETRNKYEILAQDKTRVGYIAERGGGFWRFVTRSFWRSHRSLEVDVLSGTGEKALFWSRSFFFLFSDLFVRTPMGEVLGSIHRRFGILYKRYDLRGADGQVFARIKSPIWRLWTFPVVTPDGRERAVVTKRWGGGLKEIFTDADTFLVDFGNHQWTDAERAVLFSAAISIDFDFFEKNQGMRPWDLVDT